MEGLAGNGKCRAWHWAGVQVASGHGGKAALEPGEPPRPTPTPRSLSAQEGLPPGCWAPLGLGLGSEELRAHRFQVHAWLPHCFLGSPYTWWMEAHVPWSPHRYVHKLQNTFLYLECLCSGYRGDFFPSP